MDYAFCPDCKAKTQALWDHATGDIICTECALVLESHCVDQTPEYWRTTFTDDSKDNDHPVRIGQPTTSLEKCVLSTVVTRPNLTKSDSLPCSLSRKQIRRPDSDKSLVVACTISDMIDRLGLIKTIKAIQEIVQMGANLVPFIDHVADNMHNLSATLIHGVQSDHQLSV